MHSSRKYELLPGNNLEDQEGHMDGAGVVKQSAIFNLSHVPHSPLPPQFGLGSEVTSGRAPLYRAMEAVFRTRSAA